MKHGLVFAALAATVLTLSGGASLAADEAAAEAPAAKKSAANKPSARKAEIAAKRKAAAKTKRVDINSASAEALKKLPGIGDAEAERIIANRPYGSKAWLATRNVIPQSVYMSIKSQIEAKQPEDSVNPVLQNLKKK